MGSGNDQVTLENINALLQRYGRFGIHLGLEASHQLLADLGHPHQRIPIIHVAGTNGKGSVCAYLSSVLTAAGYRVGCYTSPHLVDWTERICIDQQPVVAEKLYDTLLRIEAIASKPTQFEVITAAAWCCFESVDIAVIEVGLGGRLDATNVHDAPLVSVITSISRDHWQRLGPTLADIAYEKAGILKPNCAAVVGPLPGAAEAVVREQIAALSCPTCWPQPAILTSQSPGKQTATAEGITYDLRLLGDLQLVNSGVAIATLQTLRRQGWSISDTAIATGMANTTWPGRLQWTQWQGLPLLLDGAHNEAAAIALRQYVDSLEQPVHWLMGMLSTKDHAQVLTALLRPGDRLSLVPVPDHSSADPRALQTLALDICPALKPHCQIYPTLEAGLQSWRQTIETKVLCGSLYLVGQFLAQQSTALR
jgi:dihydrofolate synthase / folylpolyglutamate synthase